MEADYSHSNRLQHRIYCALLGQGMTEPAADLLSHEAVDHMGVMSFQFYMKAVSDAAAQCMVEVAPHDDPMVQKFRTERLDWWSKTIPAKSLESIARMAMKRAGSDEDEWSGRVRAGCAALRTKIEGSA